MSAFWALPSESLPTVNLACAPPGLCRRSGADPKAIKAKENFVTNELMDGQKSKW